jgi:hypothetical protein
LTLNANPSSALHATPKQYVDTAISTHASDTSLHLTTAQNTFLDAITVSSGEVNQLAGVSDNVQTQIDSKLAPDQGTMSAGDQYRKLYRHCRKLMGRALSAAGQGDRERV